jgi:hypothetical protein
MIYVKIYFLISFIIGCLFVGLRLFFYDIDLVVLRFILASFLVSVPLAIAVKIFYGEKLDEITKRPN